jgi:tetratricopeptide (TPR) repeat protein
MRGDLHRNRGQPEQALADFAAALQLDPDSVEAYLDRGVTYRDQNRLDEAMADLDRAVQLAPKNPDLRIARASIEELHHVEPDAMTDLMRAIQFRPDQATYSTRAAFYARIGRRDQALAQGAQGIARALKGQFTAGPQVGRGLALLAKGRVKEANAILDRAAETSADSAKAIAARALGLLVAKQVGRAIATLDPSIANGSEEPLMFVLRGKAFYQNGELDRANADFDQALKLRPLYPDALTARGSVWLKKKDYGRAVTDLDQSLSAHPTIAAFVIRGMAYEMQGKCSLAIADYRKAREMKPDEFIAVQAQTLAKGRLEQLARRNSCGPGAQRRLASGGPMVAL